MHMLKGNNSSNNTTTTIQDKLKEKEMRMVFLSVFRSVGALFISLFHRFIIIIIFRVTFQCKTFITI